MSNPFGLALKAIAERASVEMEALAVSTYGPVGSGADDVCAPPAKPVTVECWHCADVYGSDELRFEYRPMMQAFLVEHGDHLHPLWWCRNIYCDGGGFKHDLWPSRKKRRSKTQ